MLNQYYSGQGSLYVAKRNASTGKPEGFARVGNVPELNMDIKVDKFEHKESESGSRLLDLTIIKQKSASFKFKLENLNMANLALGFFGDTSEVAGGTIAAPGEVIHIPKGSKGLRFPLANPKVSTVVVKDAADTITYTVTTDYTVDANNGVIILPDNGAIVTAAAAAAIDIHVTYAYGGYSNLEAFTTGTAPERWLRFEGLNTVDGTHVIIDLYRAQFDPLNGYNLISDDVASVDMSGSLLSDPFITDGSPFFRQRNIS